MSKLPTVLLLGVMVIIFASLMKQNRTLRFRLWFIAWAVLFVRFVLQMVWRPLGLPTTFYSALDLSGLQLAGIIFFVSVSAMAEHKARNRYFVFFGGPIIAYSFCLTYGVTNQWIYTAILLSLGLVPTYSLVRFVGPTRWNLLLLGTAWATLLWSILMTVQGRPELGFYGFMTWIYAATAVLFCRKYQRVTPGIVATAIGFVAWAAISPIAHWAHYVPLSAAVRSELWNLPKFVVAIGMIVTLLEDERIAAELARLRERTLNLQMRRFADLTSQLFSGTDLFAICTQLTKVITETSNFQRAVIVLSDEPDHYVIAGHDGYGKEELDLTEKCVGALTQETFTSLARPDARISSNSFRAVSDHEAFKLKPVDANADWEPEHKIVIPLRTSGKGAIGAMGLSMPRVIERVNADDLTTLEILASDIAGAVENSNLQQHLFRSEKLAGMGQLVTGVAHELNNPLTSILGYSEILGDRVADVSIKRDLDVMRREALRMKRIIENLQRFSRQQRMEKRNIDFKQLIEDILKLRAYDAHALGIHMKLDSRGTALRLQADETMLHQVFMNVLNNAMEALAQAREKNVTVEAKTVGDKLEVRVMDSGPGFADLSRVFDPFYTTKPPGKGTGLGLSICYGIVKEHGGEIEASNLQPHGACISISLPTGVGAGSREPLASGNLAD